MMDLYYIIGFFWMLYAFWKNEQAPKTTKENWFPVLLFSFWLWFIFLPIAWNKGIIQEDLKKLSVKIGLF